MAENRRTLRDIIFGETRVKRYNFFADDYPISTNSYVQGYNTEAGMYDLENLGNGGWNSAVVACLQVLGRSFAEAKLIVEQSNLEGETEYIANHPLELLMKKPNKFMSGDLISFYIINSIHIFGDAYLLKQRNNLNEVVALYPLMPAQIQAKGTEEELITHYVYEMKNKEVILQAEDVIHIRMAIDPTDHKKGFSPLKSVLREVFGDESAGQLSTALLANMGVPSIVITPKDDIGPTEDEAEQISRAYQRKVAGAQRGMPLVLSGAMNIDKMSFSPKELDIGMLRNVPESRISAVLGVPAIIAGLQVGLQNGTYSNAKELRESFTENTLIPLWRVVAQEIENQLLKVDFVNSENQKLAYDISSIRALQQDVTDIYERMNLAVQNGWATLAEARRAVGLPVTDEHEVYFIPNDKIVIKKEDINAVPLPTQPPNIETSDNSVDRFLKELEIIPTTEYKVIKEVADDDGNIEYCVYSSDESRSFGCYPTRELAEARLLQIERFGEERYITDNGTQG